MQIWKKTIILLFLIVFFSSAEAKSKFLLIFAGAGMRMPLDEIGKNFEKEYKIKVVYDYEGSGRLGNKILVGQKPDVFIPGSEKWAKILKNKDYVKKYFPLAYHVPVIITPLDNTKVNDLTDFVNKNVKIVIGDSKACAIGKASNIILKNAGLDKTKMNIVAFGVTVKQLVQWIEGKNADASIVWHADAVQSTKVRMIVIPKDINCVEIIPVCEMSKSQHPEIAKKYIDYILSKGKIIFEKHGFKIIK